MNVKLVANKVFFKLKEKSPTIALGLGIGCGIAAVVMACKATPKAQKLIDEASEKTTAIRNIADNPESGYTENDKQKALVITWTGFIAELIKVYGPAIALEIISILLLVWSHKAVSKRVFALSATVATLSESLRRVRSNIVDQYGEEKANDIWYGISNEKIEEISVDEETGKEKKVKVPVKVVDRERVASPYAVFFDKTNPNYNTTDHIFNVNFISDTQLWLQQQLSERKGYLFLNEARQALGFKMIPEGQILGWEGSDKIELGIDNIDIQSVRDFRNGYEKVFMIDFPDVHPIIDKITELDWSNRTM